MSFYNFQIVLYSIPLVISFSLYPSRALTQILKTEKYASSKREIAKRSDIFYQVYKEPMEYNFDKLSKEAVVTNDKVPYSGWFYPETTGGTNYGNPSALKLYDQAFNAGKNLAQDWEKQNHTRPTTDPDAQWSGHCNGWAASSIRHAEPRKRFVERNGVRFDLWHIKALLAEVNMDAIQYFLAGERCDERVLPARTSTSELSACDDVNPGMLHAVIANWIGRKSQAIVMDMSENREVWNHATYGYKVLANPDPNRKLTRAQAESLLFGNQKQKYLSPDAVDFRQVRLVLTYADAFMKMESNNPPPNRKATTRILDYILELDANGNIIGGEWIGESVRKHPDFVWVPFQPIQSSGLKSGGNPHVSPKEVFSIWAESIGADPNKPPQSIMFPEWINTWGQFPNFSVMVDGFGDGTAFLRSENVIKISRRESFRKEKLKLEVSHVSGEKIFEFTFNDEESVELKSPLMPGLNKIVIRWNRVGVSTEKTSMDTQVLNIHVI